MNILVLFGATGDLARKKVIPAIAEIQKTPAANSNLFVFGVGRKDLPPTEFNQLVNNYYVAGELDTVKVYKKLYKQLVDLIRDNATGKTKNVNLVIYSSLPPHVHTVIAALIHKEVIVTLKKQKAIEFTYELLLEKPIGHDLKSAQENFSILEGVFGGSEHIKYVDHYLAKEPLLHLRSAVHANPGLFTDSLGAKALTEIEAVLLEDNDVSERGAFYDNVGALFDVGQNHLLQLLSELMLLRIEVVRYMEGHLNAKPVKKSELIDTLMLTGDPTFGQYLGYHEGKGIDPKSSTETYFNIKAKISAPMQKKIGNAGKDLSVSIVSAKKSGLKRSGVYLGYANGASDFIDMVDGKKSAYQNIFESILFKSYSVDEIFAKKEEIASGWKFVSRAKKLKVKNKIIVYSTLRDILD